MDKILTHNFTLDIDTFRAYLSNYYEPDEVDAKISRMVKTYGKKEIEDIE